MSYAAFIAGKLALSKSAGFEPPSAMNPSMFGFQRETCEYLIRIGRGAAFLDTGLGKTLLQLEWARCVVEHTHRPAIVLAPLAVAAQTVREADKFGIDAKVARDGSEVTSPRVYVANYERLDKFDVSRFAGVVLDESSILKSFMGATKRRLCESFAGTPYRLCCTATPAPNDYMEIGNHADFLGVMPSNEMLSRWFINDTMNFGNYRLKNHAIGPFWDWVASWARCVSKPSDLGYSDDGFALPELRLQRHVLDIDMIDGADGKLFRHVEMSATSLHNEKRRSLGVRAERIAEEVNGDQDAWVVWCDTDYEADALTRAIPDAIEVRGSQSVDVKESRLLNFSEGRSRVIVTKPSIAGFGLNWQHCSNMAFVGVSYSYESFYQAVRRCWRFGQKLPVDVHVAMAQTESGIWDTVTRKADNHENMKREMRAAMMRNAGKTSAIKTPYEANTIGRLPEWLIAA